MEIVQFEQPITEREAADWLRVSIDTLRRIRTRREIGFIKIGGRFRYTQNHLADYLESRSVMPCQESKSQDTGSPSGHVRACGTPPGSTSGLDKQSATRLASMTFGKPK